MTDGPVRLPYRHDDQRHPRCGIHLRRHFCIADLGRRQRISREMRDLIGCGLAGPVAFTPGDYGLGLAELAAEHHRLVESGWPAGEVAKVLVDEAPTGGWPG